MLSKSEFVLRCRASSTLKVRLAKAEISGFLILWPRLKSVVAR